jgi:predicted DNA-binding transcriptional regulator AlpA
MPKPTSISAATAVTLSILSPVLPETGFLRQPQVLVFIPISKSTLCRRVLARSFPQPMYLSARVTVWRAEDIRRWIVEQGRSTAEPLEYGT